MKEKQTLLSLREHTEIIQREMQKGNYVTIDKDSEINGIFIETKDYYYIMPKSYILGVDGESQARVLKTHEFFIAKRVYENRAHFVLSDENAPSHAIFLFQKRMGQRKLSGIRITETGIFSNTNTAELFVAGRPSKMLEAYSKNHKSFIDFGYIKERKVTVQEFLGGSK